MIYKSQINIYIHARIQADMYIHTKFIQHSIFMISSHFHTMHYIQYIYQPSNSPYPPFSSLGIANTMHGSRYHLKVSPRIIIDVQTTHKSKKDVILPNSKQGDGEGDGFL